MIAGNTNSDPLTGKVALVTGASRGIGAATAVALGEAGADVVITGRNVSALKEVQDRVLEAGANCTTFPLDLTDLDGITRLMHDIGARWGRLDLLVHSAAVLPSASPLFQLTPEIFSEALAVNVAASHALLYNADPLLRRSDKARIVLLTSPIAKFAVPEWSGYAATKAAQEMLFECYAKEVADIANIRVVLINPGAVRTEMRAKAFPEEDPMSVKPPEAVSARIVELFTSDFENLHSENVED